MKKKYIFFKTFLKDTTSEKLCLIIDKKELYSKYKYYVQLVFVGLIVFFMSLEFPSFHYETYVRINHWFTGMRVSYLLMNISAYPSDLLIIVMGLFSLHRWRKYLLKGSNKYLIFFLIVTIISMLTSKIAISSGACYKLFNLFLMTALFSIICYFFETDTKSKIHFIFYVILMMALFQSTIAIMQYFKQAKVGLIKFERCPLYYVNGKNLWLFDRLFNIARSNTKIARAFGTLTHPNVLGGYIFFSSMIGYYFFYLSRKWWKSVLFGLIIFLHFFTISITYSRASMLAFIIATVVWFALFFTKPMKKYRDKKKLIFIASWFVGSVVICLLLFYFQFQSRGGIVNYNSYVHKAADIPRMRSIMMSLNIIKNNFFWGIGLENSPNLLISAAKALGYPLNYLCVVHNIYLLIASETGIIGGSIFLVFIVSILKRAILNLSPLTVTLLSTFVGLLFIGNVDFYLWRYPVGRVVFFIIAGFLSAIATRKSKEETLELYTQPLGSI